MASRRGIKGRFGVGGLSFNQVAESRKKSKTEVLEDLVEGGFNASTGVGFNITIELSIINNLMQSLPEPKAIKDFTESLIRDVISGSFGKELASYVKGLLEGDNGYQDFISFMKSNQNTIPVSMVSIHIDTHGDYNVTNLKETYSTNVASLSSKLFYCLEVRDSLGNSWGYSYNLEYGKIILTPFVVNCVMDDSLTAIKDGFTSGESYSIIFSDKEEDIDYICNHTADGYTAIDKAVINLNTLILII